MMKQLLAGAVVAAMLTGAAAAGPLEDGLAAYGRGDYGEALRAWKPLAEEGDAAAQFNLGVLYATGRGVQQDLGEAVKWYRAAAEQGLAGAQYNLGLMHFHGRGVLQDDVLAHKWFNLAASRGHEEAVKGRELATSRMTPGQIAEAQRLAREWEPSEQR